MKKKADINITDKIGWTPLHAAVYRGHTDIARLFLDRGVPINEKTTVINNTPLHLSAYYFHKDTLKLLLERKADINIKSNDGWTPLLIAAQQNQYEVVVWLLINKANIMLKNNNGCTAQDITTSQKIKNLLKEEPKRNSFFNNLADKLNNLLTQKINNDIFAISQKDKIKKAKNKENFPETEKASDILTHLLDNTGLHLRTDPILINRRDKNGNTLLFYALKLKICSTLNILFHNLIIEYTDFSTIDTDNQTILGKLAYFCKNNIFFQKILEFSTKKDVNWKDYRGDTLLHLVASNPLSDENSVKKAKLLIKKCSNINSQNKKGTTPLHLAIIAIKPELTKFLLKNGANAKSLCNTGLHSTICLFSVLDTAIYYKMSEEIIQLIKAKLLDKDKKYLVQIPYNIAKLIIKEVFKKEHDNYLTNSINISAYQNLITAV